MKNQTRKSSRVNGGVGKKEEEEDDHVRQHSNMILDLTATTDQDGEAIGSSQFFVAEPPKLEAQQTEASTESESVLQDGDDEKKETKKMMNINLQDLKEEEPLDENDGKKKGKSDNGPTTLKEENEFGIVGDGDVTSDGSTILMNGLLDDDGDKAGEEAAGRSSSKVVEGRDSAPGGSEDNVTGAFRMQGSCTTERLSSTSLTVLEPSEEGEHGASSPGDIEDQQKEIPKDDADAHHGRRRSSTTGMVTAQALSKADLREVYENEFLATEGAVVAEKVEDQERQEEEKKKKKKQQRKIMFGSLTLLVVAIVIIVVAVTTATNGDKEDGEDETIPSETTPSSTPAIIEMPTTNAPTSSPTSTPTLSGQQVELLEYLKSIALTNTSLMALDDTTSPQYKAFLYTSSLYDEDELWLQYDGDGTSSSSVQTMIEGSQDRIHTQYALASFYYALDGDNWNRNDNWLDPTGDFCNWYTTHPIFFCSSSDSGINWFELPSNNLKGTIPDEIGLLTTMTQFGLDGNVGITGSLPLGLMVGGTSTSLERLRLDGDNLRGSVPSAIGLLSSLQYLDLSFNPSLSIDSPMPTEFGNLRNLQTFKCELCSIAGSLPTELGQLTRLTEFGIRRAAFDGTLPSEMGNLVALKHLDMAGTWQITGTLPDTVYELTRLTNLQLTRLGLAGTISPLLGRLSNLQIYQLGWNKFSGTIPTEIGLLTDANKVDLWYSPELTGPIPSEIGNLRLLDTLNLQASNYTGPLPSEIGQLELLQTLNIAYNEFLTGIIPSEVGDLSVLQNFILNGCEGLSGTLPSELAQLSQLKVLNAAESGFTGTFPTELILSLPVLETFGLGSRIVGSIPSEIGLVTTLKQLYLHKNELTGTLPTDAGLLTSLQELAVSDNRLSGNLPMELSNLIRLEEFHAQRNQFSSTIDSSLGSLFELRIAYFDGNEFVGTMPSELCSVPSLYADCDEVACPCCNYCCQMTVDTEDAAAVTEECVWNGVGEEAMDESRAILPYEIFPGRPIPPNRI